MTSTGKKTTFAKILALGIALALAVACIGLAGCSKGTCTKCGKAVTGNAYYASSSDTSKIYCEDCAAEVYGTFWMKGFLKE